ncbi:MAG: hypothetical protein ABJK39_08325 [Hyphomicrobiales bacterium]
MKNIIVHCAVFAIFAALFVFESTGSSHAQSCLNPAEQRKAVSSGAVRPFGAIASQVRGELVNARLCKSGGRLVYVVTVLRGSKRVNVRFDARNGQRL